MINFSAIIFIYFTIGDLLGYCCVIFMLVQQRVKVFIHVIFKLFVIGYVLTSRILVANWIVNYVWKAVEWHSIKKNTHCINVDFCSFYRVNVRGNKFELHTNKMTDQQSISGLHWRVFSTCWSRHETTSVNSDKTMTFHKVYCEVHLTTQLRTCNLSKHPRIK